MISQEFLDLLDKMKIMHIDKNAGYSGMDNPDTWANFRLAENFGVSPFIGCMIRMSDKFSRVQSLIKNEENERVGEKLTDTLLDLASYCLIAICLYEETEIVKQHNAESPDWYKELAEFEKFYSRNSYQNK